MCQQQHEDKTSSRNQSFQDGASHHHTDELFPWSIGVLDAHCHPTDTMPEISSLPGMKAQALTIMATRSQDQHLVAEVAERYAVRDPEGLHSQGFPSSAKVIPSFGWHPWFSYQLYDDTTTGTNTALPESSDTLSAKDGLKAAAKKTHYQAVLQPQPTDDTFIASLPEPSPLSAFLSTTKTNLESHPHALIGEVGLDKAFRLPQPWSPADSFTRDTGLTPGGREGRLLSPHRVNLAHQQAVLSAQLRLAGEMGRAVSVHGVQAHGVLHDTLASTWKGHEREVLSRRQRKQVAQGAEVVSASSSSDGEPDGEDGGQQHNSNGTSKGQRRRRPFPPRICLHSFSGGPEVAKQYLHPAIPCDIFFSFSTAVNLSTDSATQRFEEVLKVLPETSLLIESDLHVAGERMDDALESIARQVCTVRGWTLDEGLRKLRENFVAFVFDRRGRVV